MYCPFAFSCRVQYSSSVVILFILPSIGLFVAEFNKSGSPAGHQVRNL